MNKSDIISKDSKYFDIKRYQLLHNHLSMDAVCIISELS